MKNKAIFTVLLAFLTIAGYADNSKITNRTNGSITFVVDEDLTPGIPQRDLSTGKSIANYLLSEEDISNDAQRIIATSFSGENNLMYIGKDAFYRCIVEAYANHQSVTLSPDMVWLVISQGFARYVNAHAEDLRPKLVSHEGKMDLAIMTEKDLLSEEIDWPSLINDFASQIGKHTKDSIAGTITSDFTTTGPVERVASQITLMESVKSYFEYIVYRIACGIPYAPLRGESVLPSGRNHRIDGRALPVSVHGSLRILEKHLRREDILPLLKVRRQLHGIVIPAPGASLFRACGHRDAVDPEAVPCRRGNFQCR